MVHTYISLNATGLKIMNYFLSQQCFSRTLHSIQLKRIDFVMYETEIHDPAPLFYIVIFILATDKVTPLVYCEVISDLH